MTARTRDFDLLRRAVAVRSLSRSQLRWVTTHRTRLWEYPWALRQVDLRLPGRKRAAADIGAGKSPVPIALARRNLRTLVADPADQSGAPGGSEWSWTDYTRFGIGIHGSGMESLDLAARSLGFVLCISVIEHVPAVTRRAGLAEFSRTLEPGGICVLTVDLMPKSDRIWNRAMGKQVEPDEEHGSLPDLISEATGHGLVLEYMERSPLPGRMPEVDVVGLVFRRSQAPSGGQESVTGVQALDELPCQAVLQQE